MIELDKKKEIIKVAKQMMKTNQDVGEKCGRDDSRSLAFTDDAKKKAWKSHYQRLLNEEFDCNKTSFPEDNPMQVPAIRIEKEMLTEAVNRMKNDKTPGPTGMFIEMLKADGDASIDIVTDPVRAIIHGGKVPLDWQVCFIGNSFKGKGELRFEVT